MILQHLGSGLCMSQVLKSSWAHFMCTDDCSQFKYLRSELVPSVTPDWCSELVRKCDQQKGAAIKDVIPRVIVKLNHER